MVFTYWKKKKHDFFLTISYSALGLDKFDELEKRLSDLEVQLNIYANKIFTDGKSCHDSVDQQSHSQTSILI